MTHQDTETGEIGGRPLPIDAIVATAIGILTFVVYAIGACRTIYVGDSGELVAAADMLGIPHPSGYPLYVILGKIWSTLVPLGSVAFRMSLFSGFAAALAVSLVFLIARRIDLGFAASITAALLLGFSPSFWAEATVQRVYSLNALFVALATLSALRWRDTGTRRDLFIVFLVCGLGATNHTFMGMFAIALALAVLIRHPGRALEGKTMGAAAAGLAAGLLPYLYLPIRSRMNPALDWGNPESLDGFLDVALRRGFWHRKWLEEASDIFIILGDYLQSFGSETLWIGALLAVIGLGWTIGFSKDATQAKRKGKGRSKKKGDVAEAAHVRAAPPGAARFLVLLGLLVMAGNVGSLALHGSRLDLFEWHRYYIPSYLMLALFAALGTEAISRALPSRVAWAALLAPLALLATGFDAADRSDYRIADDYSRTLLESLPQGSTLVAADDNVLFSLIYLHYVERVRPDVRLILQGVAEAAPRSLNLDGSEGAVLFTHHPNQFVEGVRFVPVGLAFQATPQGAELPPITVEKRELDGEDDPAVPRDYLTRSLLAEFHFMKGTTLHREGWPLAQQEFRKAMAAAPDYSALFYNLGLTYANNGLVDEAVAMFERVDEIDPRGVPRPDGRRALGGDRVRDLAPEQQRLRHLDDELRLSEPMQGLEEGTPEYHRTLARLLVARGEALAARGHGLRAIEIEARAGDEQ